jgi:uncharacterized membrane protein
MLARHTLFVLALVACSDSPSAPSATPEPFVAAGANSGASPAFATRQLGLPSGAFGGQPADINDQGDVVGEATTGFGFETFVWRSGTFLSLAKLPGYSEAWARATNNNSWVVGQAYDRLTNRSLPIVWQGHTQTPRALSGFDPSGLNWAHDVSDDGIVVGEGRVSGQPNPVAFKWASGTGLTFLSLGGGWSQAYRINRRGQILGLAVDIAGTPQVVVWSPSGAPNLLPVPAKYIATLPTGLSDGGTAVGWTLSPEGFVQRGVRWTDRTFELLALPRGMIGSIAADIDNAGRAYGFVFGPGFTPTKPVVWMPNGTVQMLPDPSNGASTGPVRVNRCGRGVGSSPSRASWTIWMTDC